MRNLPSVRGLGRRGCGLVITQGAGTSLSNEFGTGDNDFSGTVHRVQIDIDENAEDVDHLITPEERWHVAMAR